MHEGSCGTGERKKEEHSMEGRPSVAMKKVKYRKQAEIRLCVEI